LAKANKNLARAREKLREAAVETSAPEERHGVSE